MKKSNFATFLILLLLSFNTFANFDRAQKQELTRKVFKSEQLLKSAFENDIKSTFGVKEVFVDVELAVNSFAIYKEISVFDDGWSDIRDMQLPNMFIDPEQQLQLRELKMITNEHILSHIKSLNLVVSSPYDVLNEEEFKEKLEAIVASNIVNFKKVKFSVELKKIIPMLKDSRNGSLTNPYFKLDTTDFNLDNFKSFFIVIAGVLCVGVILYALFLLTIRNSVKSLRTALEEKEFSGNLTMESSAPQRVENEEKQAPLAPSFENLNLNSYYKKLELLRNTIDGDFTYIKEMIELELAIKSKNEICVLLAVLPGEERSELYANLQKEDIIQIKSTIFSHGEKLFNDIPMLCATIDGLQKLITLTSLKEENFYHFYLKKIVKSLSKADVISNLRSASNSEFYYLLDNISAKFAGEILANAEELEITWHTNYSPLSEKDFKPLIKKLALNFDSGENHEENLPDPRHKLLPLLSGIMEEEALTSLGMGREFKFSNLVSTYFDIVAEEVKRMSFENMCSIMAVLEQTHRAKIITTLPEVLAERINLREFSIDAQTYTLKATIHKKLMALHSEQEVKEEKEVDLENFSAA